VLVKNFAFRDGSDELSDSKQIFKTGLGLLGVFVIHFHNLFSCSQF